MNVLDEVMTAELKAEEAIKVAKETAQKAVETAKETQIATLEEESKNLQQLEADAVSKKQAELEESTKKMDAETQTKISGIEKNFSSKKGAVVETITKHFQ